MKQYPRHTQLSKAFGNLSLIQSHFHGSRLHDLSTLLLSCTNLKLVSLGKQTHGHAIVLGLEQHHILLPKLVNFYASFNLLVEAYTVVKNSISLLPFSWNLLIYAHVKNGHYDDAILIYKQMQKKGILPDNFTYPSVLKACGKKLDFEFGQEVHRSLSFCCKWSLYVHNALIFMYGKFGEIDTARHLFDIMPERDAVSFNSMISIYGTMGMWEEALDIFGRMQMTGIEVNIITWNILARGFLQVGNYTGALELLSQMRKLGFHLDSVAILVGLGACSYTGFIRLGKEFHCSAIRYYYDTFENVQNALITMYAECKDLCHAYRLFTSIENKSIATWNSMFSGYTRMDRAEEASFLLREMLLSGLVPNDVTIASGLSLCARVGNLQHGKEFHCYLVKREDFKEYLVLWNALIDMYAKSGFGMQGEGHGAIYLFDEMIRNQIKPDHITMVSVLSACSHSGFVTQGQILFAAMQSVYGLTPRLEHYSCMVDLFARAGLLRKAKDIITHMPYSPTTAMWATLIGASQIHGNAEIAEWAADKLMAMTPLK